MFQPVILIVFLQCLSTSFGFKRTFQQRTTGLKYKSFQILKDSGFSFESDKNANVNNDVISLEVPLGDGYQALDCQFRPIFQSSYFFTVTYDIPFGLNVDKPPRGFPAPIVTKDSKRADGEKEGDVLRATTCWSQGFQAAGATSDIMMFAGNVKWRKSVFETAGAPWQEVLDALLSNTEERSKTVTLVFERETEPGAPDGAPSVDNAE